jgi:hypothetical protein
VIFCGTHAGEDHVRRCAMGRFSQWLWRPGAVADAGLHELTRAVTL